MTPLSEYSLDELLGEIRSRFEALQPVGPTICAPVQAPKEVVAAALTPKPETPVSLTHMDPPSGMMPLSLGEVIARNQAQNGVENVSIVKIRPANPNIGIRIVSVTGFPEWDDPQIIRVVIHETEMAAVLRLCNKMANNPRCSHVPRNCHLMESIQTLHVTAEPSVLAEILCQWKKIYPGNIQASSVYEGLKEVLGTPSETEFRSRWSQKLLARLNQPGLESAHVAGISRALKIINPAFREMAIPDDWYEQTDGEHPLGVQRRANIRMSKFKPSDEPMQRIEDFFHD